MPHLSKPAIQITVLDDRRPDECQAGCGIDWASPEEVALANQRIKERFGDRVKMEYLNMSGTDANNDMQRWKETIQKRNLLLPLLLLNGNLRISGQFDIRQMLDAIEVEIELGR